MTRSLFFCICLLQFTYTAWGQGFYDQQKVSPNEVFELNAYSGTFYITEYIDYYYDSLCDGTIQIVSAPTFEKNFKTYQNVSFQDTYHRLLNVDGCHWARVSFKNTLKRDTEWYMMAGAGSLVDVYYMTEDGKYIHKQTGENRKVQDRDVKTERGNKVKIFVPSETETVTLYIRLETTISQYNYFNVALKSPDEWHDFIYERNIIQGIFQGIVWIMLLYNMAIFVSLRDRTYLYYALYLLVLSLLFYVYFDFNADPLLNNFPTLRVYLSFMTSNLVTVFYFQFLRHFLQTKEILPKWDKVIKWWMLTRVVLMFIGFFFIHTIYALNFPYENSEMIFGVESVINFIILISIYKKGSYMSKFFMAGTFALYTGVFLAALGWANLLIDYGIGGSNSGFFIQIGVVVEILSFSLGLGYRIRKNENEKQSYQEKLILQLRENEILQAKITNELEDKVRERTKEIEAQKAEIIKKSEDLKVANKEIYAQKETAEKAYTQLKAAQESLVRSEKMASLGQLTAGIAHEINNPINFVSSNIKPLKKDFEELKDLLDTYIQLNSKQESLNEQLQNAHKKSDELDTPYLLEEIENLLNGIEIGAERTKEIVAGLKSFSRLNEDTIKRADVHAGINNTLLLLGNKTKGHIEIIKEFGEGIPSIECYPGQLNQVFMNLLDNAIGAIEEKGIIRITTKYITGKKNMVEILFEDNGIGMSQEVQKHIFEPFFTTKEVGKGSGLGLSITYGIIKQHQGNISVDSKLGKGATFKIKLPIEQ